MFLTQYQVESVYSLYNSGVPCSEIARTFDVGMNTVNRILNGQHKYGKKNVRQPKIEGGTNG
jgi:transposase